MAFQWGQPYQQNTYSYTGGGSPVGQNMFYQQGNTYGAAQNYNDSPLGSIIREKNPQLAYTQFGQNLGISDTDSPFNRWFLSQYPKFERGYGLATLQNPFITIDQFLATMPTLQQMMAQYQMLAPSQRGVQQGNFAPAVRWIGR